MAFFESPSRSNLSVARDLFRKPVPTFRDHALRGVDLAVDVRSDAPALDPVDMERDRGQHPGIAEPMDLVKPGLAEAAVASTSLDRAQGHRLHGGVIEGVLGFGQGVVADRKGAPGL